MPSSGFPSARGIKASTAVPDVCKVPMTPSAVTVLPPVVTTGPLGDAVDPSRPLTEPQHRLGCSQEILSIHFLTASLTRGWSLSQLPSGERWGYILDKTPVQGTQKDNQPLRMMDRASTGALIRQYSVDFLLWINKLILIVKFP